MSESHSADNRIPDSPAIKSITLTTGQGYCIIRKKGKLDTSHRYDLLPLLRSSPGGIQRELVVYDFPECKGSQFFGFAKKLNQILSKIRGNMSSTLSNFQIREAPTIMTDIGLPPLS